LIGGHPSRVQVSQPGICRSIGGLETVSAEVASATVPDNNYYSFTACLRGPHLASTSHQVMASLLSTKFSDGA
jgi:hypothetical protein